MRNATWGLIGSSLIALAVFGACNDSSGFKGGTPAGTAKIPEAADSVPEVTPASSPAVLPAPTPTPPAEPETTNVFKDCESSTSSNFVAELYKLPVNTQKLPNFPDLPPVKKICLQQIDIANRKFTEGFPGVEDLFEWFALNINFNLKVTTAGDYKFRVNSDDGSKLIVDGVQLIDNDNLHSAKSAEGVVNLTAGSHKINLQYFQGPADEIALELFWTPPDGTESPIPTELITR